MRTGYGIETEPDKYSLCRGAPVVHLRVCSGWNPKQGTKKEARGSGPAKRAKMTVKSNFKSRAAAKLRKREPEASVSGKGEGRTDEKVKRGEAGNVEEAEVAIQNEKGLPEAFFYTPGLERIVCKPPQQGTLTKEFSNQYLTSENAREGKEAKEDIQKENEQSRTRFSLEALEGIFCTPPLQGTTPKWLSKEHDEDEWVDVDDEDGDEFEFAADEEEEATWGWDII